MLPAIPARLLAITCPPRQSAHPEGAREPRERGDMVEAGPVAAAGRFVAGEVEGWAWSGAGRR